LTAFFDGKELLTGIKPDEAVARGAAIQGELLTSGETFCTMGASMSPYTFSIQTGDGVITELILRNTVLPNKKSQDFSTIEDNRE